MRSSRGYTLIELVVYCFLSLLLLAAIGTLFVVGRRMFESSSGSYMIGQEIEAGMRFLRQDLQETALMSLRVYPNSNEADRTPGVTMVSARSYDNAQRFLVSRTGAPEWNKHVFYVLEPTGDRTGSLIRWERPDSPLSAVPTVSGLLPLDAARNQKGSYKRTVIRNLLLPGVVVKGAGKDGSFTADADYGGFKVSFVRQEGDKEELSPWNPTQVSARDEGVSVDLERGNTRVVEVRLTGLLTALQGGSRPSLYSVKFRVAVRH